MTLHAGQPDGKPVCGMNATPNQLIPIDLEGPIDARALAGVTCKSCLRLITKRTGATSPAAPTASAQGSDAPAVKKTRKPRTPKAAAADATAEPVKKTRKPRTPKATAAASPDAPAVKKTRKPRTTKAAAAAASADAEPVKKTRKPRTTKAAAAATSAAASAAEPVKKTRKPRTPKAPAAAASAAPAAAEPVKKTRKPRTPKPAAPAPVAAAAPSDDSIRSIVREEIALGIEQLLRFTEAADVLAVSRKVVQRLVDAKQLSVVKVSKKKQRITASSVEAYIRRQTI